MLSNPDGNVVQRKARYVAKGYAQQYDVDYFETFAPVCKMKTIRFIMAVACQYDLDLHQADVASAYLYGTLKEEVYMEQPVGYEKGEGMVCKLVKGLYGLKQAGRVSP